jgi:hypothetical protein
MKVRGYELTDEQITAGVAAMRDTFVMMDIVGALSRAGVPTAHWIANRAADRLLQNERKAGRIYAVNNKNWANVRDSK